MMECEPQYSGEAIPSKFCYIYKNLADAGIIGHKPRYNSECSVEITDISVNGLVVDPTAFPEQFSKYLGADFSGLVNIGWGDSFVDKGLETCIQTLYLKEKSSFTLLFPKQISSELVENPPENPTVVKCTIFLGSFSEPDHIYVMTNAQLCEEAEKHKTQGIELFKQGRTVDAFLRFGKAFKMYCFLNESAGIVNKNDVKHLGLAILNDLALCQFKFGNHKHSVEVCSKALTMDASNEKSLYRRAVAYMELKDYNAAEDDLLALLKVKPHAQYVIDKYKELKTLTKDADEKYAAVVKKMFS